MPQLPEQLRPVAAFLGKHHFWLLALLVPLILLPLLFVARAAFLTEIKTRRAAIKSQFDALQQVRGIQPHPNADWQAEIDAVTARVRRETLAEWEKFWQSQESFRTWPPELGEDFLKDVAGLKAEGKLRRNLLQRYQNQVPELVRKLPARMGAEEAMGEERGAGDRGPGAGGDVRPQATRAAVTWEPADQQQLLAAFTWNKLPSSELAATTQVVLAQEELWVYGLFCDAVARANNDATGPHNAAIVRVDRLAVGYPTAEEPGEAGGAKRIVRPKEAVLAGDVAAVEQAAQRTKPSHPRFGGDIARPLPGTELVGEGATPPEMRLREWIYVDFDGKPLAAADLATAPAARMTHLMPFVLRVVMDQRRLDPLLVDLARSPVPIDVREVRINPGAARGAGEGGQAEASGGRTHDVIVELRGTVGLATPPTAAGVGLEPAAPPAAAAGGPGPRDAFTDRVGTPLPPRSEAA